MTPEEMDELRMLLIMSKMKQNMEALNDSERRRINGTIHRNNGNTRTHDAGANGRDLVRQPISTSQKTIHRAVLGIHQKHGA